MSAVDANEDEFDKYCIDMMDHDIFNSIGDPINSDNSLDADSDAFDKYCIDMQQYDIYHIQLISNIIFNSPSHLLFDLLRPYFKNKLSQIIQNKLESGFILNGINGKALRFIDELCLQEMDIFDINDQYIILNAINQIYLIFNTDYHFTFDLLYKYLKQTVSKKLEHALKTHKINGEALIFIDRSWLEKIFIFKIKEQNNILNAINKIYNIHTFSAYISTFPLLTQYNQLLIANKINLNTFKNNARSNRFYHNIGITNKYIITQFKQIFSMRLECMVQCCDCNKIIIFDNKSQFRSHKNNQNTPISYYIANKYGLTVNNKHSFYRLIYGQYTRIFCHLCAWKLNKCELSNCNNWDLQNCLLHGINFKKICANHPKCKQCPKRGITSICMACNEYCCCTVYSKCMDCITKPEINELTQEFLDLQISISL